MFLIFTRTHTSLPNVVCWSNVPGTIKYLLEKKKSTPHIKTGDTCNSGDQFSKIGYVLEFRQKLGNFLTYSSENLDIWKKAALI